MSIKVMSAIFETEFRDLPLPPNLDEIKPRMARASSLKLVLLAIADHANDEGESAYPGLTLLERKTGMSRQGLIDIISALKYNGLLTVDEMPSRLGTNNYILNLGCFPCLLDASQVTLLVKPLDYPSQATLPDLVKPLDLNHQLTVIKPSNAQIPKKKTSPIRGIEAAIATGRPITEDDFIPENIPGAAVLEALAAGFHYNFPKYGENMRLDRIAKLIVKDGRDIKTFIAWAKANKRDPHWYHLKPDSLWGDWPQAFNDQTTSEADLAMYRRPAFLDEDESKYVIPD